MKNKPEIEKSLTEGNKLIEYGASILVTKTGTGAHIILPKELIGKRVKVHYKRKNET